MNGKIFCLALGTFVLGTDAFIVAGILPSVAAEYHVTVARAAQVVAAFSIVYAVGAPIFATLLGSVPRRPLLLAALAIFIAANLGSMRAPTFGLLLATRVVAAAAASIYSPIATSSAAVLAPPAMRGRAIAMVTGGLAVATVLGVPLGTWIGTLYGWRVAFTFVSELGVAALALLITVLPSLPKAPVVTLRARAAVWARSDVLMSLCVTALAMTGVFTVYTFLVPILHRVTILGAQGTGLVLLVYGVGTIIGNALGGFGADRFGAYRTLVFAILGLFVSLPVFTALCFMDASFTTTCIACLAVFVWGAVGWAYNPAQSQRLLAIDPKVGPITLSANGSAIHLGIGLGSTLGGALMHRSGSVLPLGAAGGCLQVVAVLALVFSVRLFAAAARKRTTGPSTALPRAEVAPTSSASSSGPAAAASPAAPASPARPALAT